MTSTIHFLVYFLFTSTFLLTFTLSQENLNTNDYSQTNLKIYFQKVCTCVKLKECKTMLDILVKVPLTDWLTQSLRKSSCGFNTNHEPMVCCPNNNDIVHRLLDTDLPTNRFGLPKFLKFQKIPTKITTTTTTTSEKPWIWDRLKIDSSANEINQNITTKNNPYKYRFDDYLDLDNIDYNENLIDFEDPNTYKNCPPSFYNDFNNLNKYNNFLPQSNYWNNDDNLWNNNLHHHNRHNLFPLPPPPPPPPSHLHHNFPHQFPHHYPNNKNSHTLPNQHYGHHDYDFNLHQPKLPNPNRSWPKIPFSITTTKIPKIPTNNDDRKFVIRPKENNINDKRNLVNPKNCGLSVSTRIIGGIDSVQGQFPWMARIAYRNRSSQTISFRCAGSLINDRYIVTAAHCVTNLVETLEVSHIRLGEQIKTRNINCENDSIGCLIPQDYQIEQILPHLNYDTPKYANDIALIRLVQTSIIPIVTPICLPMDNFSDVDKNLFGQIGTVAGWQSNVAGSSNQIPSMQWVQLPIVNTTDCSISYARFSVNSRFPIIISSAQICAQGTEKADACQGDSGGPLMRESIKNDLRYTLIGLVSFGPRTCGISNYPGVYTRVSSYVNWILDNIIT